MARAPKQARPPRRDGDEIVDNGAADRVCLAERLVDALHKCGKRLGVQARLKLERECRRESAVSHGKLVVVDVLADIAQRPVALDADNLLRQVLPDHARCRLAKVRFGRHACLRYARVWFSASLLALLLRCKPPPLPPDRHDS